jgi:hypothetical protein
MKHGTLYAQVSYVVQEFGALQFVKQTLDLLLIFFNILALPNSDPLKN